MQNLLPSIVQEAVDCNDSLAYHMCESYRKYSAREENIRFIQTFKFMHRCGME